MFSELDTPSLVIDLDAVRANVAGMAGAAARHGVRLRPHIKTHKMPELARMQLDAGACGITRAKLGEAEAMADAGIDDILPAFRSGASRSCAAWPRCASGPGSG
ncbi:alanine racemase [Nonomuraea wenchangensis]|uniref:alanine racemase n=1 Tax=Nonomuraea wenchangensis TaxID=568860 RepID=UPI00342FC568